MNSFQRCRKLNFYQVKVFAPDWYHWQRARSLFLARDYAEVEATAGEIEQPPYEVLGLVAASHARLGAAAAARETLARFHEAAAAEMASYPGDDAESWRHYWSNGFPYQDEADLAHLLDGLRRAGLAV